uniref:Reverse transcriptase domain-containing protein n=1 Tax=Tanacetum cinerariifolium TaxID=118510 RepID=A0A6L2K5M9_TANCI|nr:reverse transcriptase domain-containing protein [Tanacetum cinerariifolium]
MLGEHNITYLTRTSVKGQILADFLVEKPDEAPPDMSVVETPQELWTLFTDGSSCVDGSEYEALIAGLRIITQMGVRNVHVSVDSKLVANQVLGTYVAKEEYIIKYLEKAKILVSGFTNFSISQVPRSKNKKADAMSKIASTSFAHLSKQVLVEVLKEKSVQEKEVATVVERSFRKTWLRCVGPLQANYVIREIHERSYSMHTGPRSVVVKAMQLGYYWPLMHQDARDMIRKWIRKGQVFDYRYGLFYKVDRGKSRGDNHRQSGEEVYVGQYSVPLWPFGRNSLGQERRERAAIHEAKTKLKMTKYYNAMVRGVTFRLGDFVYRSNDASHAVDEGKLGQSGKDLMRSRKHSKTERTC